MFALYQRREIATFIGAILVSVILLSVSSVQQANIMRAGWLFILSPIQETFAFIPSYFNLKSKNKLLRQQLAQIQIKLSDMEERGMENTRLRKLISLKKKAEFTFIPAEVIGWNTEQGLNSIVINVGDSEQIKKYMAVVMENGVLGRVLEVGPFSSHVQLLSDRSSRISGIIQRSRERGIIRYKREELFMEVSLRADVLKGDKVVTSGLGGTYPSGLAVGMITKIKEGDVFKKVSIAPAARFNSVEEVFVITGKAEETSRISRSPTSP